MSEIGRKFWLMDNVLIINNLSMREQLHSLGMNIETLFGQEERK